jgi:uncharacterized protein YbbC (DUF1343 family)
LNFCHLVLTIISYFVLRISDLYCSISPCLCVSASMLTLPIFMLYFIVLLGIDRLLKDDFRPVQKLQIGLLSNISCCDSTLEPTVSLFEKSKRIRLKALFAPEHGFYTALQDQVKSPDLRYHEKFPIFSLYGRKRKPALRTLKELDAIVIDLPDIGTRYYTFLWSAIIMIGEAAKIHKRILVLDRPNPLNGVTVEGPSIDPGYESFVGLYSLPVRHGMTIGEMCTMLNQEYDLGADITVIKLQDWSRAEYADGVGGIWTMPSPNMPNFSTALVYPGMCLLEGTNISEGRGTTRPFEILGAPWVQPYQLVRVLEKCSIRGAVFRPTFFIPTFHKYCDQLCGGIAVHITNRRQFAPVRTGIQIIEKIHELYPDKFRWRQPPYEFEKEKMPFDILIGNSWVRKAIEKHASITSIEKRWQNELLRFKRLRRKYLLYH